MISFRIDDGALVLPGKDPIHFPQPVKLVEQFDEVLVVLLEWSTENFRNVYAVDREGRVVWRIEEPGTNALGAIYLGIGRVDARIVRAVSSMGVSFDIVARTGKVVRTILTK
jgi:hypothetical protein